MTALPREVLCTVSRTVTRIVEAQHRVHCQHSVMCSVMYSDKCSDVYSDTCSFVYSEKYCGTYSEQRRGAQ